MPGHAGGGDDDVGAAHLGGQVARAGVAQRDGGVLAAAGQQQAHRPADRDAATDDDDVLRRRSATSWRRSSSTMPRGVHGSGRRLAEHEPAEVGRVQAVGVLGRVDRGRGPRSRPGPSAAAAARCSRVQAGSALSSSTAASTSAWVASAGRSTRIDSMPTSAQSRCLPRRTSGCPGRRRRGRAEAGHDAAVAQRVDPLAQLGLDRGGDRLAVEDLRVTCRQSFTLRRRPPRRRRSGERLD